MFKKLSEATVLAGGAARFDSDATTLLAATGVFSNARPFDNITAFDNTTASLPEETVNNTKTEFMGIVSGETLRLTGLTVNGCLLPAIVLCGVIMNGINMAVFLRQGLRDRINLCLFSLALSDSGFNLFHFVARNSLLYFFDEHLAEYWDVRGRILVGVYLGFLNTSNLLVMVLSLERCICVISPLHAKTLLTARQMAVIIIAIFTMCLCGSGLTSFIFIVGEHTDPETNATRYYAALRDFSAKHRPIFTAVSEITFNTAVPVASLTVVMTATIIIAGRMRSVMAWRRESAHSGVSSSSANRREASVTRMLQVVTVVYTICTAPTVAITLARNFIPEFFSGRRYNNLFNLILYFMYMLEAVNCSVNFIIYYTMSTKYRETFQEMFCRRNKGERRSKEGEGASTTTSTVAQK